MVTFLKRPHLRAFTLVELLIVMAIVAILLSVVATSLSTTGGRESKTSAAKVSAILTSARADAIARGEPVGVVFFPTEGLPESLEGKAGRGMGIFSFEHDETAGTFTALKQLDKWRFLNGRVIFSNGLISDQKKQNAYKGSPFLKTTIALKASPRTLFIESAPAVVFSERGQILHPDKKDFTEAVIGLWEGEYLAGEVQQTRHLPEDLPYFEEIVINHISGRSRVTR